MYYIDKRRENISDILNIDKNQISIKATTTEKLGFNIQCEGAMNEIAENGLSSSVRNLSDWLRGLRSGL